MTNGENPEALVQCLGQISRTVRSLAESVQFYRDKLGVPHLYSFDNLGFFDLSDARLFVNETAQWNKEESILYFSVADIDLACASLRGVGVEIIKQPHLIHTHDDGTQEWMAFLADPEGRPLGLMSLVKESG